MQAPQTKKLIIMLAQFQKLSITSLDELVISPTQFIDFMNDANDVVHPIGAIRTLFR